MSRDEIKRAIIEAISPSGSAPNRKITDASGAEVCSFVPRSIRPEGRKQIDSTPPIVRYEWFPKEERVLDPAWQRTILSDDATQADIVDGPVWIDLYLSTWIVSAKGSSELDEIERAIRLKLYKGRGIYGIVIKGTQYFVLIETYQDYQVPDSGAFERLIRFKFCVVVVEFGTAGVTTSPTIEDTEIDIEVSMTAIEE